MSRGGQAGNNNAAKNRPWTRALERHAAQNPELLAQLAEKTFAQAMAGDMAALKEIGDRLDGKPKQSVDLGGPNGEPLIPPTLKVVFPQADG